jgi:phage regulator Rha-like protein
MNDLLKQVGSEDRADSRILADRLQNQHKNVLELIERYPEQMERFGKVAFKTEPLPSGQRGRVAYLNEDQCYFLLSLSRNSDHVVDLKANLVEAFRESRESKKLIEEEYKPTYRQLHDTAHELAKDSSNEKFIHLNLNKAVNKAVGIEPGQRKSLGVPARSMVTVAQMVATKAMEGAADHREGYQRAKESLSQLSKAISVPTDAR